MPRKGENVPKSSVRGMSPERDNRPLSDVAPEDSAGRRGHGAHGSRGHTPAEHMDPATPEPDGIRANERATGSAGWGNASSGGSTVDKRRPED